MDGGDDSAERRVRTAAGRLGHVASAHLVAAW